MKRSEKKEIKSQIKNVQEKISIATDPEVIAELQAKLEELNGLLPVKKINAWIGVGISIATLVSIVLGLIIFTISL